MLIRQRNDRGAAMVLVAILVVLSATVAMGVAAATMTASVQTVGDQARVQALAAAEGGRDATLASLMQKCTGTIDVSWQKLATGSYRARTFWSAETDPTKLSNSPPAAATLACPPSDATQGYIGIASQGLSANGKTSKSVFGWYKYDAKVESSSSGGTSSTLTAADGAIIEGGSTTMNLPSVTVKGDLILGAGNLDCNGSTVIDGDLVLTTGSVDLSNTCKVTGSIVAKDDIYVHNLTNQIGGDVISTGGTVRVEGAQVGGSIEADGGVKLNNSVHVIGDVIARGNGATDCKGNSATGSTFTGSSSSSKSIGGSVKIGGALCQMDLTTVTGSITATGSGSTSIGGVGAVTASTIKLAGSCSPCTATPTPQVGVTNLAKVDFTNPKQIGYANWLEAPWTTTSPDTWTKSGWTVVTAGASNCNYQSNSALVTAVNNLTQPTVIDASACGTNGLNFYGVTFSLKTDVTFIAKAFNSAQNIKITASDAGSHTFNLIVPDASAGDNAPSCPSGSQSSTIYGATMGTGISGLAYSPCTLAIGTVNWRGQLIAGYPNPAGGNATITYTPIGIPGATASGGGTVQVSAPGAVAPAPTISYGTVADTAAQQTEPSWSP
ncbi:FapA family protein [Nocardioides sp. Kera G14]|uniref:FapA family protein n=1 Tax=Nocardioides sp. Kera G14 TaxID=2884264 RepID=UPI001D10FBDC|nr:FapA family protein [Nocardioides sp. Kera G14]UDY23070.1 FapA family protein [Nocardioides sp. Kera G14]